MAEKAYHFEIPNDKSSIPYIQNDYWETFYKGLLAPERILLDLRRMEKAYLENDEHKSVSTESIILSENLSTEMDQGVYETSITDLNDRLLGASDCVRIVDMRVQIISQDSQAYYKPFYAKITQTSGSSSSGTWSTGIALSNLGKLEFCFQSDCYLPFEGASLSDSFTLSLKTNANTEFQNAKVVLFVSYIVKS